MFGPAHPPELGFAAVHKPVGTTTRPDDQVVDPDRRYAIFGDRSNQQFEAQSRYPIYLKAEKDAFQALIGDFDTGLNKTTLGRYARRLTGGRAVPVPGGVLVRDADNVLLGAVGISGDASPKDEECCIAGIEAAGLVADTGDPA